MATRKRKSEPIFVYVILGITISSDADQVQTKSSVVGVYKCSHRHIKNKVKQLEKSNPNPMVHYFISDHQIEVV